MKQKFLYVVAIVCIGMQAFAGNLDLNQVKTIAARWLDRPVSSIISVSPVDTNIYNVRLDKGTVVVCGQENVRPIVAYTYDGVIGRFIDTTQSLAYFYQRIKKCKPQGINDANVILSDTFSRPQKTVNNIMLTTQWEQSAPYNDSCPLLGSGKRAIVGCVATAMGQIINYWKYPNQGYGFHSYEYSSAHDYTVPQIDFSKQRYNWDQMSSGDISKLLFHVGVSLNAFYGSNATPAYMNFCDRVLKYYWGYSVEGKFLEQTNYENKEWLDLIKTEIDNKRPVLYSDDAFTSIGHAFVIDGYDENGLMHLNFGWGGLDNGYYCIDKVDDGSLEIEMITHIEPEKTTVRKPDIGVTARFSSGDRRYVRSFTKYDPIHIDYNFYNTGNEWLRTVKRYTYQVFVDGKKVITSTESTSLNCQFNCSLGSSFELGSGFSVGTHTVSFMVDTNNEVDEYSETDNTISFNFEIVKSPSLPNITFQYSYMNGYLWATKDVNTLNRAKEILLGDSVYLNVILKNTGDTGIYHPFDVVFFKNDTLVKTVRVSQLPQFADTLIKVGTVVTKLRRNYFACRVDTAQEVHKAIPVVKFESIEEINKPGVPNILFKKFDGTNSPIALAHDSVSFKKISELYVDSIAYVRVRIANTTMYDITTPFRIKVETFVFGDSPFWIKVESLRANSDTVLIAPFLPKADEYSVNVTLDVFNEIDERDESDNYSYTEYDLVSLRKNAAQSLRMANGNTEVCAGSVLHLDIQANDSLKITNWYSSNPKLITFANNNQDNTIVDASIGINGSGYAEIWYTASSKTQNYVSLKKSIFIKPNANRFVNPIRDTVLCDKTLFQIGMQADYEYLWSDRTTSKVFTVKESGTYAVTISDIYSCAETPIVKSFTVGFGSTPKLPQLRYDDSKVLSFDVQNYALLKWYKNGDLLLSSETTITNPATGDYQLQLEDKSGCAVKSAIMHIDAPMVSVSSASVAFDAVEGNTVLTVSSNTTWTASSNEQWLQVSPSGATNGNASLRLSAAANTSTTERVATISVSATGAETKTIRVTQAAASIQLSVSQTAVSLDNGQAEASLSVSSNTTWMATSNEQWLQVSPNGATNGNASLRLSAAANTSTTERVATITVSATGAETKTVRVTQAAASIQLSVSQTAVSLDNGQAEASLSVSSNTTWTASSNEQWLQVSPNGATSGNASLRLSAAANTSTTERVATITVSATGVETKTIRVTQAAASIQLSVSQTAVSLDNGQAEASLSVSSNTTWTATSNEQWLQVSPNGATNGNASLRFSAAANSSTTERVATISVSATGAETKTIRVTQAAASIQLSVSQTAVSLDKGQAEASLTVSSNTTWTASSNEQWLQVSPNGATSGNASLRLSAAANTSTTERVATISVSAMGAETKTIRVTQAAAKATDLADTNDLAKYYYVIGNTIMILDATTTVYSIEGQALSSVGQNSLTLITGVYIVCTPQGADRIVIMSE